jgi:hypothetical protein
MYLSWDKGRPYYLFLTLVAGVHSPWEAWHPQWIAKSQRRRRSHPLPPPRGEGKEKARRKGR